MIKTFCVFEGGGAKGVAHAGVLKAIEEINEFKVQGYAGTSAGAIVAALAASGWSADELFEKGADKKISSKAFSRLSCRDVSSLADILSGDWKRLERFVRSFRALKNPRSIQARRAKLYFAFAAFLFFWPLIYPLASFGIAKLEVALPKFGSLISIVFYAIVAPVSWVGYFGGLLLILAVIYYLFFKFRGVSDLRHAVEALDELLSEKITPMKGNRVSFLDIKEQKNCDLKIVAANIRTGVMKLFDATSTPDVPVSDAVAASAAIPIVFRPISIGGSQYCDGGLVSNLPAWTFDRERLVDDECVVITSELSDQIEAIDDSLNTPQPVTKAGFELLERIARTAVFGASGLNTRGLHHHISLKLDADIGVLELDNTEKHAAIIENARITASGRLKDYIDELKSLKFAYEAAERLLIDKGVPKGTLRAGLVREVKLVDSECAAYQLWHSQGFDEHFDDRVLLPVNESLVGGAVLDKRCVSLDLTIEQNRDKFYHLNTVFFRRKFVPSDRDWVVVIPLNREDVGTSGFPPDHISIAVTFDGSTLAKLSVDELMTDLRGIVDANTIFTPYS
ncbi:patatin-like phospholipase family protein [Roseovarius sp. PS-C2]|uniref:patatin-like phospholipase family protein n=1 Tax=Roseovarius sp. PS-C2 TaxID=2820814 RepID=UPI001C0B4CC9|nr:patatin-like phospholipase family protein [Roseovarius sp. PS-C2]MBU3261728.1 patatin-like phospholipase family protein [Roseovarius sp. PS-C2]